MKKFCVFFLITLFSTASIYEVSAKEDQDVPVATRMVLDAAGELGRSAVKSVYMIYCPKTNSKGTGFLIKSGYIITNEHVIRGNSHNEIVAHSPYRNVIAFSSMIVDAEKDIAVLKPSKELEGGLELYTDDNLLVGASLSTWGFPLGYNGPAPLLSVGYLSGFSIRHIDNTKHYIKHLVVNGAFNPGNSGGPLFLANDNKVIGIVVSKHAPISKYHQSAIDALASGGSGGMAFTRTDSSGKKTRVVESQVVAEVLMYFREMTQVMIGEAISVSELKAILSENNIKY
jgi:S1-C subfamily serine protease